MAKAKTKPGPVANWPLRPWMLAGLGAAAGLLFHWLTDHRYDLDRILAEIGPRTKLVYLCHPNNPTGTMNTRDEIDAFLDRVPPGPLVVIDQAYREYVD
ncbi:MAG: aminotransferase class I/II-fold pyridoxal phosphate-dependent enzyme, partial [Sphingomicrobium sp.]